MQFLARGMGFLKCPTGHVPFEGEKCPESRGTMHTQEHKTDVFKTLSVRLRVQRAVMAPALCFICWQDILDLPELLGLP